MEQTLHERAVQMIARHVLALVPRSDAERTTVCVEHRYEMLGRPCRNSWTGTAEGFARRLADSLYGTGQPDEALPIPSAAELEHLRNKVAGLETIVGAATEYRVWNSDGMGLYVRRAVGTNGFAVLEGRIRAVRGRRAWTPNGWQFTALLSEAEVYCWPDAATALTEAQRLANENAQGSAVQEDADVEDGEH
ncbi:hypothetical protein PV516_01055 [Streptomyces scabiei]|uniref:hypothetical protein n=1 Tax=Streptomyces scabiei TaxID=1930 RepID=UPI0029BEB20B|nr:hypothetical protein [Streptomyces scabiei]MDX3162388.1 hypothetical protein [Streptomyces scabiei]